jgi:ParB family transcriptional regulator, chromosome partitioning protein
MKEAVGRQPQLPTPNSQPPRRGLGRGLGALIPRGQTGLLELELDRIAPNPQQPRLQVDEASLDELAESIHEHGVLQPVVVARVEGQAEGYFLVAGERRWRAARLAGLTTIPALVKEAVPRQRLELALVENIQREDLSPLELAAAYRALIDEHGLTQEQVARRVGKSRVAVANTLRLLQLPRQAREALAAGRITEGHARALLAAPDEPSLLAGLRELLARGLTVRETEELARRLAEDGRRDAEKRGRGDAGTAASPEAVEIGYLEERFRQALGTRVQIVRSRRGGRLVIHFYSDEELEGLYETIVGSRQ